jgi:hypothetical protein
MPYPNSNILNIVIPQTSGSLQAGQAPFVERIISGSNLILQTDSTGTLIGSSDLNMSSITASNITASGYISASNLYVKTNITDAGTLNVLGITTLASLTASTALFSGMVSASAGLTSSASNIGTLTVVGNSVLSNVFATNITASNISASGNISASTLRVETSIVDGGSLTVLGNTVLGDAGTDTVQITGSTTLTGSLNVVGNSTLQNTFVTNLTSSNISASGNITSSNEYIAGNLTVIGVTTLGNLSITNLTASNISASNTLSASNVWFGNSMTYVETMATGSITSPDINFTSTATTGSDIMFRINATALTGSVVALEINASGSQTSYAISASNGIIAGSNFILSNITASGVLSASRIVASEITASSELFVGTGPAYRTYGEASVPENLARLYVSGSATIFSKYATLNLATSASDAGAQSSILFSRLASSGSEAVLSPRMQLGTESGSTDLRVYAYYSSTDPDIVNQAAGANIVAGTRAIFKQSGYFGVGSFISYGAAGGATTTYVSSLPGYSGIVGPDAMLTILPMDSASLGTAGSKQYNRNILNIMSYDTSSIMFISGSDGYVLLGKNTTDGINRLQVMGNVSASAYTGSSANFTSLIATNLTASNISASGNISASTLVVTGTTTLANIVITNLTASNISASGNISASTLYITNNGTINGNLNVNGNSILGDSLSDVNTSSGSLRVLSTTQATDWTTGALTVAGGVGVGKNLYVSGSTFLYGDLTIYGTSSIVNISSSTVIVGDNRVVLNALTPYQRYAGIDVYDSGSANATASLLWDGETDNWITVDQNNSASNMIIGPTASFGSALPSLTVNRLTKAYEGSGITDSLVSDDGTTLRYTGNVISASSITASYGTVTYITGALVTYVTGSFNILQVSTGSSPGTGQVPSLPTNSGFVGQITVDNNFIYVYTGNIWKRVPISNWTA